MVGILLITHGSLGTSLIDCARHVLGNNPERIAAMGIDACSTIEDLIDIANQKTQELNNGSGVLILTDMFGGSPSNITQALVQHNRVQGVSGVNLPMLVRAITYRHENLETVVKKALSGGGEGVLKLEESQETRVC